MISALVKIHTPILPESAHDFWSDLGFSFVQALVMTRIPFRIVPTTVGDLAAPGSNWTQISEYFATPFDDRNAVVNLVVGGPRDVNKFWSSFLPVNIAITERGPYGRDWTDEEVGWFGQYDEVWVRGHQCVRKLPQALVSQGVHVRNPSNWEPIDELLRAKIVEYS